MKFTSFFSFINGPGWVVLEAFDLAQRMKDQGHAVSLICGTTGCPGKMGGTGNAAFCRAQNFEKPLTENLGRSNKKAVLLKQPARVIFFFRLEQLFNFPSQGMSVKNLWPKWWFAKVDLQKESLANFNSKLWTPTVQHPSTFWGRQDGVKRRWIQLCETLSDC